MQRCAGAERCCSPASRDRARGSPRTSQGCDGVYFGRRMAGLSLSKQLYLLGAEMKGVGPFLAPLPHPLTRYAHPCISRSHRGWIPHLPHPNTCCFGFSSLPTSAVWLGTSRGWEQFVSGCSRSACHSRALVSNLPPKVIPTRDASMEHRAIRSLGLLGGGLARSADADLFAEVPRGLHEPLFLANSA